MSWEREQDEMIVLGTLLSWPESNRWELDGLEARLFTFPALRDIASELIRLRDEGRHIHWRRVRLGLVARKRPVAASMVEPLVQRIGTSAGLTAAVSRLHAASARRAA
jgi:hypothetical protein